MRTRVKTFLRATQGWPKRRAEVIPLPAPSEARTTLVREGWDEWAYTALAVLGRYTALLLRPEASR